MQNKQRFPSACSAIVHKSSGGKGERLAYLDYAKVLGIGLVIVYHCGLDNKYNAALLSMCVPLFFTVNGILMLGKERSAGYLVKKNAKILWLLLFWGTIQALTRICLTTNSIGTNELKEAFVCVYQLRQGYDHQMWFLATLFILNGLNPVVRLVLRQGRQPTLIMLSVIMTCTLWGFNKLAWQVNPLTGWHAYALIYYIMGYVVMTNKRWWQHTPIAALFFAFISSLLLQTLHNWLLQHFFGPHDLVFDGYKCLFIVIASQLLVILLARIRLTNHKLIMLIADNTLGIYLTHTTLQILLHKTVSEFTTISASTHFPLAYLEPIILFCISALLSWCMSNHRTLRHLVKL